jgi:hypothetical protein
MLAQIIFGAIRQGNLLSEKEGIRITLHMTFSEQPCMRPRDSRFFAKEKIFGIPHLDLSGVNRHFAAINDSETEVKKPWLFSDLISKD